MGVREIVTSDDNREGKKFVKDASVRKYKRGKKKKE